MTTVHRQECPSHFPLHSEPLPSGLRAHTRVDMAADAALLPWRANARQIVLEGCTLSDIWSDVQFGRPIPAGSWM